MYTCITQPTSATGHQHLKSMNTRNNWGLGGRIAVEGVGFPSADYWQSVDEVASPERLQTLPTKTRQERVRSDVDRPRYESATTFHEPRFSFVFPRKKRLPFHFHSARNAPLPGWFSFPATSFPLLSNRGFSVAFAASSLLLAPPQVSPRSPLPPPSHR
ncbi:hypothetical protein PG993_000321 [Apiospora rasikravindrae]|uniref:Uncharacterized protein n=1 Tax=Apiospora rasikravindrae TaxID=990691 RepID=A0ABR1U880_9PEZI